MSESGVKIQRTYFASERQTMIPLDPDYPRIVLAFHYRGFWVEIDRSTSEEGENYAAWANYATGCAVAVPSAPTRAEAVQRAKAWIDRRHSA
jgi:hypothetical protein